jgi:predicted TIM-barrel fold metal-dependent hydrolase
VVHVCATWPEALDGMTGVVHAQVDLRTNEAIVEHIPGYVDAAALIAAVRDAGYDAGVARTVDDRDVMARRPRGVLRVRLCLPRRKAEDDRLRRLDRSRHRYNWLMDAAAENSGTD